FLCVSLGECVTERSGRINLGLEGTLVLGAMTSYAVSFRSGSPWVGVVAAGFAGMCLGVVHAALCQLRRVNDIAIGLALMLFGPGIAFFFGKPYIQSTAPRLSSISLGFWSQRPEIQNALQVNPLFLAGIALALGLSWAFRNTR